MSLGLFNNLSSDQSELSDLDWLARNAFFEARNGTIQQQLNVNQVVYNRVENGFWGNSVKEVFLYKNNCEFSWLCDGKSDKISSYIYTKNGSENTIEFKAAVQTYYVAAIKPNNKKIEKALFYHSSNLKKIPKFFKTRKRVHNDGLHIFYN